MIEILPFAGANTDQFKRDRAISDDLHGLGKKFKKYRRTRKIFVPPHPAAARLRPGLVVSIAQFDAQRCAIHARIAKEAACKSQLTEVNRTDELVLIG